MKICQPCHTSHADDVATCTRCGESSWRPIVIDAGDPTSDVPPATPGEGLDDLGAHVIHNESGEPAVIIPMDETGAVIVGDELPVVDAFPPEPGTATETPVAKSKRQMKREARAAALASGVSLPAEEPDAGDDATETP